MTYKVSCPHCGKIVGGSATDGGMRIRMKIVLFDMDTGSVHGPCPRCKQDIVITHRSVINKDLFRGSAIVSRPSLGYIS